MGLFKVFCVFAVWTLLAVPLAAQPPEEPAVWEKAEALAQEGDFAGAIEMLTERLAHFRDEPEVTAALFSALRGMVAMGQEGQALKFCSQWAREKGDAFSHAVLSYFQLMAGLELSAENRLQQALAKDAQCPEVHYGLALLHERMGEAEAAREAWRQFLLLEQEGPLADAVRRGWVVVDDRPVAGPERGYTYPTFSPDGRRFLVAKWRGGPMDIVLFDPATGQEQVLVVCPEGQMMHRPLWSPDGRELFYERYILQEQGRPLRAVLRAPLQEGATGQPIAPDLAEIACPSLTADGATLCFEGTAGAVSILSLTGGKPLGVFSGSEAILTMTGGSPSLTCDGKSLFLAGSTAQGAAAVVRVQVEDPAQFDVLAKSAERRFAYGTLSPDEANFAVSQGEREGAGFWDVWVCDTSGQTPAQRLAWGRPASNYRPFWSPDGRKIAYLGRQVDVRVLTLGGLRDTGVALELSPAAAGLLARVACQRQEPTTVMVSYQLFDEDSAEVARGSLMEEPLALKPGEVVEFPVPMHAEAAKTAKVTAVTGEGERIIRLASVVRR